MLGKAKLSPTGRGLPNIAERIANLDRYEKWRPPTEDHIESIVGRDQWEHYGRLRAVIEELRDAKSMPTQSSNIIKQLG